MQDSRTLSVQQNTHPIYTDRYLEGESSEGSTISLLEDLDGIESLDMSSSQLIHFVQKYLLQIFCFTLHVVLVLAHVVLLITGIKHWEHKFTFPMDRQTTVSLWATAISTAFGTIYSSGLLFLMQKLAMRRQIMSSQTLTATHDNISAWTGLGSALATLYNQLSVPASIFGTLNVVGYLMCISILHITIPAILSVQTFNTTVSVAASTFGSREFVNSTTTNSTHDFMTTFPAQFLPWTAIFDDTGMPGLFNGSLYEVLQDVTPGSGEAQVSATAINITCGYLPAVLDENSDPGALAWTVSLGTIGTVNLQLYSNQLSIMTLADFSTSGVVSPVNLDSIILYTTNVVIDSEGNQGFPIILSNQSSMTDQLPQPNDSILPPHPNDRISQLQLIRCSKSLVAQVGTINSQVNTLNSSSLHPSIFKTSSSWMSSALLDYSPQDSTLLGSNMYLDILNADDFLPSLLSSVEGYLLKSLGVDPLANASDPHTLKLHDIENTLSSLVATMFWIGGHMKPDAFMMEVNFGAENFHEAPPALLLGNTTIRQGISLVRLNASLLALSLALVTSIILMILCISFIAVPVDPQGFIKDIGLLQIIWLWYTHPEHLDFLRDVKLPMDINLRTAGLTPFQLYKRTLSGRQGPSSVKQGLQADEPTLTLLSGAGRSMKTDLWSICITLHIFLVLVHLTVLGISITETEHSIVFSINLQKSVAFWSTVVATAFGTTYCSILLYATQKLAITCAVSKYSTLTVTHDTLLAWAGIGSALSSIYKQFALPASFRAPLFICGYLATISVLHVSTPALVSVETFNLSLSTSVKTQSLPQWSSGSPDNVTTAYIQDNGQFLSWLGNLDQSKTLGLSNGSLYDVMTKAYPGSGTVQVSAVGFNMSCGYLLPAIVLPDGPDSYYNISIYLNYDQVQVHVAGSNLISIIDAVENQIILWTPNQVLDSNGNTGYPLVNYSNIQFIQCSRTLVLQDGKVDSRSRAIIPNSLHPTIQKTHSTWQPCDMPGNTYGNEMTLLGSPYWANILGGLPIFPTTSGDTLVGHRVSYGEMYLMQQLGLNPYNNSTSNILYLHDIENALSDLVASLFWIGGHVKTPTVFMQAGFASNGTAVHTHPPILSTGHTTVHQVVSAARLDISRLAVSIGLGASVLLLILAITFSADSDDENTCLNDMGLLQICWVFNHHPELSDILEQVENPTDFNLREAGLVKSGSEQSGCLDLVFIFWFHHCTIVLVPTGAHGLYILHDCTRYG
ncbi:hypothetical protein C8R44DRAFT_856600 [Mycena epipterygia]|nr:hypothetical protein C8R44DRAFT_856600 [Mycena epipterygia]